jgi:hypothetical protein
MQKHQLLVKIAHFRANTRESLECKDICTIKSSGVKKSAQKLAVGPPSRSHGKPREIINIPVNQVVKSSLGLAFFFGTEPEIDSVSCTDRVTQPSQ